MSTRLSILINDETRDALKEIAAKRGVTITETVRRAVAVLNFMEDVDAKGETLCVENPDKNTLQRVKFL